MGVANVPAASAGGPIHTAALGRAGKVAGRHARPARQGPARSGRHRHEEPAQADLTFQLRCAAIPSRKWAFDTS